MSKFRNKVEFSPPKFLAAHTATFGTLIVRDLADARDKIPEPFDVFDHVGNCNLSLTAGVTASVITGLIATRGTENRFSKSRLKKIMTVAGFATGLLLNSLSETRWGMNLIDTATLGAALIPRVTTTVIPEFPRFDDKEIYNQFR